MTSTTEPVPTGNVEDRNRRTRIMAIVVATVAVIAIAAVGWFRVPDTGEEALLLSLEAEDANASCLALDPAVLAGMSPAFAGTVRSSEGESVVLDVDRWYAGPEAERVELRAPAGMEALIGGINFEVGRQYLISATDGTVNYCGYSGPVTPELQAAYDAAYSS